MDFERWFHAVTHPLRDVRCPPDRCSRPAGAARAGTDNCRAGSGRHVVGAARAADRRAAGVRRRGPPCRGRRHRGPAREDRLPRGGRLPRQGVGRANDDRCDLPHRVADEGAGERRGDAAAGRGAAADHRPGRQASARVHADDGGAAERARRVRRRRGETPHHHPRSADAHRRHQLRPRPGRRQVGGSRHHRLVFRRPGRAGRRRHGAAGQVAARRASGRSVDLRLQHRHSRRDDREDQRQDARRISRQAPAWPARPRRHALLSAGRQGRPAGDGLLVYGWRRHRAGPPIPVTWWARART